MKIAVPDLISNSYFPAAAAVELGFFKQEGLDVSLELIFPVDQAYAALRDGAVDFVGGSAHSALAAFPEWRGVRLLCAQAAAGANTRPNSTSEVVRRDFICRTPQRSAFGVSRTLTPIGHRRCSTLVKRWSRGVDFTSDNA